MAGMALLTWISLVFLLVALVGSIARRGACARCASGARFAPLHQPDLGPPTSSSRQRGRAARVALTEGTER